MSEAPREEPAKVEVPPMPAQTQQITLGPREIQSAAVAGVKLLTKEDLHVPINDATQLQILRVILASLANGELRICSKAEAEKLEKMSTRGKGSSSRPRTPVKGKRK